MLRSNTLADSVCILSLDGIPMNDGSVVPLILSVALGEIVALCGSNQAAKRTLLDMLVASGSKSAGHVFLKNRPIASDIWKRTRDGMIVITQNDRIFRELTVLQNLSLARHDHAPPNRTAMLNHIWTLFPQLKACRNRNAGTLSGGEQQMLVWARIIVAAPTVVIFEDAWHGLSLDVVDSLVKEVRRLAAGGTSFLFFEDSLDKAQSYADSVYSVL